jgi:hypothetical protein
MDEIEEAFRDGLRDAVSSQPAMAPIDPDEVMTRAGLPTRGRRSGARWIGLAAAVTLAAGLGLGAMQTTRWMPTDARETGTPGTAAQVRTLRVHNDTSSDYLQAALELMDGRRLPIGDVPAGGTVLVPMDATATANPVPSATGGVAPPGGWRVLFSGDCGSAGGQLLAVVETGSEDDAVSIQVVAAPDSSAVASTVPDGTGPTPGGSPRSVASDGSVPACTVTITQDMPTPEPTRR